MPSLYVVAAHSGVTLAPVLGELVANELIDSVAEQRLKPFRPGRFVEHGTDAELSIEETFGARGEIFLG